MTEDRMLSRLADRVVTEQDRAPGLVLDESKGLARLRRASATLPRRRRGWLVAAALACALAVYALWVWRAGPPAPLDYRVELTSVATGQWIEAPEPTKLSFSDGTRLVLAAGARARVAEIAAEGANIELGGGSLDAEVEPRSEASWRLMAGPYAVQVTGTAFTMQWDPDTQQLLITMREGSVRVTGPSLGAGRDLHAPEHLEVQVVSPRAESSTAAETADIDTPSPTTAPSSSAPVAVVQLPAAARPPVPQAGWRQLDGQGLRHEAMQQAEQTGIEALLSNEDAAGLLRLAQITRLEGDGATSQRFLAALRRRFPETLQAQTASYLAGKGHYDAGRYGRAVADLQAYRAAAPDGAFAREAQMLLILSLHALGDARAGTLARAYLAKHGNDVHAARVRKALAAPSP